MSSEHGLLSLLDGMHVFGFASGSQRSREQVIRNVALMGAAPAAGMKALTSLTAAMAYCVPDPNTGVNPAWTGVRLRRAAADSARRA